MYLNEHFFEFLFLYCDILYVGQSKPSQELSITAATFTVREVCQGLKSQRDQLYDKCQSNVNFN